MVHLKEKIETSEIESYRTKFLEAINDDLNMPVAMSVVWEIVKNPKKSTQLADLLLEFDTEAIKKEGYSLVTPVIVTNSDAYEDNALCLNEEIENGRTIINLKELSASI